MEEEIKFTCSVCGKEFPADPDTMVEVGFSAMQLKEGEESPEECEAIGKDELESMGEYQLSELGLTPEIREKLLRGEDVTTGAECMCLECQDKMLEDESE